MKKKIIHLLAQIFPNWFINRAYDALTTPRNFPLKPHEEELLNQGKKDLLPFQGFDIQTYQWGNGKKHILLVHGWEGNAGNFAKLIPVLIENGFTVHAFDGPSHGNSSKGNTSLYEFIQLTKHLLEKQKMHHVISHSFGSVATLISLGRSPEIEIEKYVGITVPNKFRERLEEVIRFLGLPNRVLEGLIKRIEANGNIVVDDVNVADYAPKSSIQKALLLHDIKDRVLPIEKTEQVAKAWPIAKLTRIENTGHFRILKSEEVAQRIVDFLV